ncbi:MAG TPA: hypothetical protein VFZ28_10765 [Burkholderiaceae bacterium]|nr:hypothetical protein [Burkholderiaceae bacterium]
MACDAVIVGSRSSRGGPARTVGRYAGDPHTYTAVLMRRTLWPFVIWLLALALPMQGAAAATMAHCEPAPDQTSSAARHDHAAPGTAHHAHDAAADTAPSHTAHGMAAAGDSHGVDATSPLQKCSACAACCIGLALPSTAFALPQAPATGPAAPNPSAHDVAFFTSGPERPPRPPLG